MKLTTCSLLLLLFTLSLWGATAETILASKHVLAYSTPDTLYLMDVNTGKNVLVPTSTPTTTILWSIDGKRLFRTYYNYSDSLCLYEVLLPSLKEKQLGYINLSDTYYSNIKADLKTDGNIYISGEWEEYDEYEDDYYWESGILKSYDLKTGVFGDPTSESYKYSVYEPKKIKPIVTSGYGIINKIADEPAPMHYELYITDNPNAKDPVYRRLTTLDYKAKEINPVLKDINFQVSPNDSLVVLSHHYYISDPGGDFGYNTLVSKNGKNSVFISEAFDISSSNAIRWTSDSRLIFIRYENGERAGWSINIIEKNWKERQLKYIDSMYSPQISYRY